MEKVNILIIGINGFIGSNLKKYIKRNYPFWRIYGIDKTIKNTEFSFKLDIENIKQLKCILNKMKPRYIFHLAGSVASKNFKQLLFSNVLSTFILLEAINKMRDYNPRVIIPSSSSEYGKVPSLKMPIKEDTPLNPLSPYGLSKAMQTKIALMFAKQKLDIVIARMFNIVGGNIPINLSIGKFAYELALIKKKKKKPVLYTKNLSTKRDFLDIKDVCKYLVAVACYGRKGEVYNICKGRSYKIRFLLNKLIDIAGIGDIRIVENKEHDRENDMRDSFGSNEKIKRIVKKTKLVSIDESLKNTYFYYLSKA